MKRGHFRTSYLFIFVFRDVRQLEYIGGNRHIFRRCLLLQLLYLFRLAAYADRYPFYSGRFAAAAVVAISAVFFFICHFFSSAIFFHLCGAFAPFLFCHYLILLYQFSKNSFVQGFEYPHPLRIPLKILFAPSIPVPCFSDSIIAILSANSFLVCQYIKQNKL